MFNCLWCATDFKPRRSGQIYCSRICRDRSKVGWRWLILKRDNHTCLFCEPVAHKRPYPMKPNFLEIARVDPGLLAGINGGVAANLATVCKFCMDEWSGLKLPKAAEAKVLKAVASGNARMGIRADLEMENVSWEVLKASDHARSTGGADAAEPR